MLTTKKFLLGGLCLLVCAMVYSGLGVRADLRQPVLLTPIGAPPTALFTPVALRIIPAGIFAEETGAAEAEPAPADERSAVYLNLHQTRLETMPGEVATFAGAPR